MARVATPVPSPAAPVTAMIPPEKIAQRAYERWVKRGRPHGSDVQDWLEAEKELRAEQGRQTAPAQVRR